MRSISRAVLVIDNEPLKQEALKQAGYWLQKIKDIEATTKKFNETDLKLYTDWFNLTIQPLRAEIDQLRADFVKAAAAYNMLVLIAKTKRSSMPEAFLFLVDEQAEYEFGDWAKREKIDQARLKRAEEINQKIDSEFETEDRDESEFSDNNDDDGEAYFKAEQEKIAKARTKYKKEILYYENLSDDKIKKIMRDFDEGVQFVIDAIEVLTRSSRPDLFRKIWELTPVKIKKFLNKTASSNMDLNFDDLIDDLDQRQQENKEFFAGKNFNQENTRKELVEDQQLRLKSLYRKIVRRIHPDNFESDETPQLKSWFDQIWQSVSKAYHGEDIDVLQGLYNKIIVVLEEHKELSISEIYSAADSLEKEYKQLVVSHKNLKDNPAWNFSSLKDYRKIHKKAFKPYAEQKQFILDDLDNLKSRHTEIERIALLLKAGTIRIKSSSSNRRKKRSRY
ncbi:MAG: hypothetical protein H7328_12730 [Bdellovibrio sp.]|nr:hypothetical protein [Bdellovibrio sp.]